MQLVLAIITAIIVVIIVAGLIIWRRRIGEGKVVWHKGGRAEWVWDEVRNEVSHIEPLTTAFKDKREEADYDDLIESAINLAATGDEHAVELLIEALGDEGKPIKASAAAAALGEFGDERAVEPLIKALASNEEDCYLRHEAAKALSLIGDERAVKPLITALGEATRNIGRKPTVTYPSPEGGVVSDRDVLLWITIALGVIGDERAIKPLKKLLSSYPYTTTVYPDQEQMFGVIISNSLENIEARDKFVVLRNSWWGWCFAFSPDGQLLAAGGDREIRLWDVTKIQQQMAK